MKKLQKIFNKVAKHLLTQNAKSTGISGRGSNCLYRAKDGLKCAAGCLISDEEFDYKYNSITWSATPWAKMYTDEENKLILELQTVHDFEDVSNWKTCIKEGAVKYGFTLIPELK